MVILMRNVTRKMIREFRIKELGYDFMGYTLVRVDIYTFHHLLIPQREHGSATIDNGAVLCGRSSHPYLHIIEAFDYDVFCYITSEMLDMNIKWYLDFYNIRKINDALCLFERENCSRRSSSGRVIIKEEYTKRLLMTKIY